MTVNEPTTTTSSTRDKYSILDNVEVSLDDYERNLSGLRLAAEYLLVEFREAHEVAADRRALKAVLFFYKLAQLNQHHEQQKCLLAIDFMRLVELFAQLLAYCAAHAKQFVADNQYLNDVITTSRNFTQYKQLKIKYHFVSYLIDVVCFYTEASTDFRARFHEAKGTHTLVVDYISDATFVTNCLRFNYSLTDHAQVGLNLLESFVCAVYQLSKEADADNNNDWNEMNATVKLMKFSASINRYSYLRMITYMTLANVFRDEDLEMLPDTKLVVVKDIIRIIKIGAESIVRNKQVNSSSSSSSSSAATTVIVYNENRYNLIELLDSLYKIAINDNMKYTLYEEFDMKTTLKQIIMHGNEREKELATRLLYQMCFDSNVCAEMAEDNELVDYLCESSQKVDTTSRLLKKNIYGILWLNKRLSMLYGGAHQDVGGGGGGGSVGDDPNIVQTDAEESTNRGDRPLIKVRSASEMLSNERMQSAARKSKSTRTTTKRQVSLAEPSVSVASSRRQSSSVRQSTTIEKPIKPSIVVVPPTQSKPSSEGLTSKEDSTKQPLKRLESLSTTTIKSRTSAGPLGAVAELSSQFNVTDDNNNSNKQSSKHIMISYNKESRDVCLRIKSELEKDGHRVWIDVEDIHGSSLESMALAIEGSKCVLICMTEKYKQSPNCRAEAEYAFSLRKPIVPLIMQKNYTPDGWLGIILGAKIFINFAKYEFDECMRRLRVEIKNIVVHHQNHHQVNQRNSSRADANIQVDHNSEQTQPQQQQQQRENNSSVLDFRKSTTLQQNVSSNNRKTSEVVVNNNNNNNQRQTGKLAAERKQQIRAWSKEDVRKWLNEQRTHAQIIQVMSEFDGEMMVKLDELIRSNPHYFLDKLDNVDLYSLIKFMSDLEKLFL